jgi:hypothetical protein
MFDNSQWSQPTEYRVMTDREGMAPQYTNDRQEADSFAYNQSLSRHGRWQVRSRTYGFEAEYKSGILEEFRPTCATIGCLTTPTKDYHQWRYCDACHAMVLVDEAKGRR